MSTPWLFSTTKINDKTKPSNNLLSSSSLHFLNSQRATNEHHEPTTNTHHNNQHSIQNPDLSTYSSYLINNNSSRSKTQSSSSSSSSSSSASSSCESTSSLSLSSLPHEDDSIINTSNLTSNYDEETESPLNFDFMSENKVHFYSEGLNSLHKEILMFADYIAPTLEELYMRNEIIWRITKVTWSQKQNFRNNSG